MRLAGRTGHLPAGGGSQSKRTGLGERGELGYMIVHGVLHLLGFDHESPRREAEMFALQDRVYARLEDKIGLR